MQDERLQCEVINLTYDFLNHHGVVYFPEDNCCDMNGVVNLFTGIDQKVTFIQTFAGKVEDTCYRKHNDEWVAV